MLRSTSKLSVSQLLLLIGLLHFTLPGHSELNGEDEFLSKADHSSRSGHKLVDTISAGKQMFKSKSASSSPVPA